MKTLSLLILTLLVAAQTASAASPKGAAQQPDPLLAWKTANDYLVGKGVLPAVSGDPVVTRAQLAQALVKITGNVVDQGYAKCAKDVQTQDFAPAVCFAAKQKWLSAGRDGTLKPGSSATLGDALQGVVRAARYAAPATRGAWYVPFVNAAVKEGIVDKADYTRQIDQPLTRGQLATMLYRMQLGLKSVSYRVGANCIPTAPTKASVVQTGTSVQPDYAIVVSDGTRDCTVARDPLARSDAKHPNLQLTGLMPLLESSNEATTVPMVDKRAYFLSKDGNLWSPYVWELDLKKGHLKQILITEAPGAVRVSPKYTFLAYVGGRGTDMRVMNLKNGLSKSVRQLETQITFLKSLTLSRNVVVSDHILIDANDALTFDIYRMIDGSLFRPKVRSQLDILFNTRSSRSTR